MKNKNIHLIPTDKPSKLKQNKITKKLSLVNKGIDLTAYTPINIYITSDEEIQEKSKLNTKDYYYIKNHYNEWYVGKFNGKSFDFINNQGNFSSTLFTCKKIILTTDLDLIKDGVQAIPDDFLEWFIKNPSCEEVKIKPYCEKLTCQNDSCNVCCQELKYKIIIPKEEPKQETLEEAGAIAAGLCEHLEAKEQAMFIAGFQECAKWQAERMYEIMNAYADDVMGGCNLRAEEWFEQNKNK